MLKEFKAFIMRGNLVEIVYGQSTLLIPMNTGYPGGCG